MKSRYVEYRISLIRVSSRLTASSARYLFSVMLPRIANYIRSNGGEIESYSVGKKTYILVFCSSQQREYICTELAYIINVRDVTTSIVTDNEYDVNDSVLRFFDYERFDRLYRKRYINLTPKWFAERRIALMGKSSRYIDHQVVLNHNR